jgi:hypothetical protein
VCGSVYLYSIKYTKNTSFKKCAGRIYTIILFYDPKYFPTRQVYWKKCTSGPKWFLVQTHVKFNAKSLGSSTDETSTLEKYCAFTLKTFFKNNLVKPHVKISATCRFTKSSSTRLSSNQWLLRPRSPTSCRRVELRMDMNTNATAQ